jgi:L-lactate utilization protein LutB
MHVVLVDNGRSARLGMEEFWTSLRCIRCGACMNTCPVYRRSGGLSYGASYSGPIGLIIDPTFNAHKYGNLPFASSLNGSCTDVCPVKTPTRRQCAVPARSACQAAHVGKRSRHFLHPTDGQRTCQVAGHHRCRHVKLRNQHHHDTGVVTFPDGVASNALNPDPLAIGHVSGGRGRR